MVDDPAGTPATQKITFADLAKGLPKVLVRQGGSATDWSSAGTTTRDTSALYTWIETGAIGLSTEGTDITVTFPTAFNQVPIVITSIMTANGANVDSRVNTVTASSFKVRAIGGNGSSEVAGWIAIGQ